MGVRRIRACSIDAGGGRSEMVTAVQDHLRRNGRSGFRHEAIFYEGSADFVEQTGSFIRDSIRAEESILVVVSAEKIELLREELGGENDSVTFADMGQVGQNPARIIPLWRDFVAEHAHSGRTPRGVGEPIWAARHADELAECERHEALLNVAFAGEPAWWLMCPYDTTTLPPAVLDEALRNHPFVAAGPARGESGAFRGLRDLAEPFDRPLAEPPPPVAQLPFANGIDELARVRARVSEAAVAFGLDQARTDDLVLAANEVATNSLRHGGGRGVLRLWHEDGTLICEIRDAGRIVDPLVGRGQPAAGEVSGFGLWLANQLCDLVQIRTFPTGSVVRLHVRG